MKTIKRGFLGFIVAAALLAPTFASAHVGYVLDHDEFVSHEGVDNAFLLSGLREAPGSTALAALIGIVLVALIIFWRTRPASKRLLAKAQDKLMSYRELLGWIARLSIGIALIGAGTAKAFISPVLAGNAHIGLVEILLGFLFLLGFLLPLAYLGSIVLFVVGVTHSGYLAGNFDFLALVVAPLLLSAPRPGLDDILSIPQIKIGEKTRELVPLVLRIGLGVAFIFLAVYEKFMNPHDSELVVTLYHLQHAIPVPAALWVLGAGLVELVLGILLIIGFEVRLVAIVSFVVISLSFFYFQESVYSHVTLFGAISMLVVLGAGKYSVDHYYKSKMSKK